MFVFAFILGCSFLYLYNKNRNKHIQVPTYVEMTPLEFKPRKYRKWKTYTKKHEWTNRYMRYLMKCKMNGTLPYAIPHYRKLYTDRSRLDILNKTYEDNCQELNLNK